MASPDRALLSALAAETADLRARLDDVATLVSGLIGTAPEAARAEALTGAQALDVLGQRLDALTMLLTGLSEGRAPEDLIRAVTLSDMAARLAGETPASSAPAAGDLVLFE